MNFTFRVDASLSIGTGHVMRCLTLANALRLRGAICTFICRSGMGNLIDRIRDSNFQVYELDINEECSANSWKISSKDAEQTIKVLENLRPHWVVVDHYSLDVDWERAIRPFCNAIMVIDDLASREHACDLLLDQNLVANLSRRYHKLVPGKCVCLLGPQYALLQPEYALLRQKAKPRKLPIRNILVFLSGSDNEELLDKIILGFISLNRGDILLNVLVGRSMTFYERLKRLYRHHKNVVIHLPVPSLAKLMTEADLAIGAAGTTSWERCCLGLPSIIITLAENQIPIAEELDRQALGRWIGHYHDVDEAVIRESLFKILSMDGFTECSLSNMMKVDGMGVSRVCDQLLINPLA